MHGKVDKSLGELYREIQELTSPEQIRAAVTHEQQIALRERAASLLMMGIVQKIEAIHAGRTSPEGGSPGLQTFIQTQAKDAQEALAWLRMHNLDPTVVNMYTAQYRLQVEKIRVIVPAESVN